MTGAAMPRRWVIGAGVVGLAGAAALGASGWRFKQRLDDFETGLRSGKLPAGARADLPPEVLVLARKLGATPERATRVSEFEQTGQMSSAPGASPMRFSARQIVSTTRPGFLWRAA